MNEIAAKTGIDAEATAALADRPITIRSSPNSYLIALLLCTFAAAFMFYLEMDVPGFVIFALSWITLPYFALNDRVTFDGKRLSRSGVIPNSWAWFNSSRRRLRISDVEQIETHAVRTLRRGGNLYYRYRTAIRGKDVQIAITSGGEDYRRMIAAILPRVSENVLDNRSIEVRDFLADPKESLAHAEEEHIPAADVLKNATRGARTTGPRQPREVDTAETERARELRKLANQLRLNGYLRQSLEAFRRALTILPEDGRILFEFARCLHSFAGAERSDRLQHKAIAALRLAERHADGDGDLLARLGETYYQFGEWRRAAAVFHRSLGRAGEGFRSACGLAEIALREGKIAHVIHHFSNANRLAETPALRRWTRGEADYFSKLNDDDEYMEMEISRVGLLETIERSKATAFKIAGFAFPLVLVGVVFEDDLVANIGWAVTGVALLVWIGMTVSVRFLSTRIPYHLLDTEDR